MLEPGCDAELIDSRDEGFSLPVIEPTGVISLVMDVRTDFSTVKYSRPSTSSSIFDENLAKTVPLPGVRGVNRNSTTISSWTFIVLEKKE